MNSTAEQVVALENLRNMFPVGSTVTTLVRYVSRDGGRRAISVLRGSAEGVDDVSWSLIAAGLGTAHARHPGLKVDGMGMDMGYHTVARLSQRLHGDAYALKHRSL